QRSQVQALPTRRSSDLLEMVRTELRDRAGLSDEQIDTGGMQIVTTIDAQAQAAAERVIAELPEDRPDNNRVALVSLDPNSGAIRSEEHTLNSSHVKSSY